ncbi:hypothetical protein AAGS40_02835 [Paraburkholderia sp. PREW-6R]|uniref:hypothetical protein n=1 Tax=Paraburkholderia sp. PREW-6R TaxID=3141544 RepID=UPI0031F56C79
MLSEPTSDQHDSSECGHCGAPLDPRLAACPSCHAPQVDSFSTRPTAAPQATKLRIPLPDPELPIETHLPARRIWRPSSSARTHPYALLEEPVAAPPVLQRMRQPLVLSASALLVASAVYLGFIHSNDASVPPPIGVSGKVQTQSGQPSSIVATRRSAIVAALPFTAPARPAQIQSPASAPAVTAAPGQRRGVTASASAAGLLSGPAAASAMKTTPPDSARVQGSQLASETADKPRADVARHLRAARANLQQNNLSATKARLAAAIAEEPRNRDALSLRATVSAREQQRDALLSLARGCGYISRWNCVSRNAGTALTIDSSSKEAQQLVTLAQRETQLAVVPPPVVEPQPEPVADLRDLMAHH